MKHTLTLAAWNFRLARRSLLALWGIFAAQQLALVVGSSVEAEVRHAILIIEEKCCQSAA